MAAADPRLILRDDELDAGLELMMLAEAATTAREWGALALAEQAERIAFRMARA